MKPSLVRDLERICGRGNVLSAPEELLCYSYDASKAPGTTPIAVVFPRNAEQVSRVLDLARDAGVKAVPRGAGTGLAGGAVPLSPSLVVCLSEMNRILEIDAHNLIAVVEPGVVTGVFHGEVERRGLFYPPDPASAASCTLGGNVATNAGGLRAVKYGVTRNYVLGIEAVLPGGRILSLGGRTLKEVAGYSLAHLLTGSEGTLGVFTRLTLRLLPLPRSRATILAGFREPEEAAAAVAEVLGRGFLPDMMEFMDRNTILAVEAYSPAGLPREAGAVLLIEVDGAPEAVASDLEGVARLLAGKGALEVRQAADPSAAEELKRARRAVLPALSRLRPTVLLEDTTVPPYRLPEIVRAVARIGERHGIPAGTMGHAGEGNLHPYFLCDARDREEMERVEAAISDLMAAALELGGTVSGEHGIGYTKRPFLSRRLAPEVMELMKGIKRCFDPEGTLNPGKLFDV